MSCPLCSRCGLRGTALVLVLVGVIVAVTQRHSLLSTAGRSLNVSAPLPEPVDYVMVLGGGANTRPFVAAQIVRAGLAKGVLVPRFEESDEVRDGLVPAEHEIIRQVVLRSGVPADSVVLLDSVVDSTASEAKCLAGFLDEHPDARVAVVTSDFHTRRTRMLFACACHAHTGNLCIVGAPTDGFDASNWWRDESGVVQYLNEFLKLARAIVW